MIIFYHRLDNSCCYLLFSLFGLSNCLRIRGYFITHPRLREVFALSSRLIACMGLAFLILLFLFLLTQISQISRNLLPSLVFCFMRISRKTRRFLSSLDFWSHTDLTNLTKAYIACARMYHPAESTRQSRQARAKRRAICEIREICVRQIHRTWFFAFFARFA